MASFKGIKERINSVQTTRKITSAMKMVSAAKLHRAQKNIAGMLPYSEGLQRILSVLLAAEGDFGTPLTGVREVRKVAIVVFSSDSSLAGAFNSNVSKELVKAVERYSALPKKNIHVYTIGKKVFEAASKTGIKVTRNFEELASKPDYDRMAALAGELIDGFTAGRIDRVELIYHHFRSAGVQVLEKDIFLPIELPVRGEYEAPVQYILEPSKKALVDELLPKTLKLKLYTALLDSSASEHAARVIAMQTATDNADQLIGELTVEYNKSRQQAITNELLDIMGGAVR